MGQARADIAVAENATVVAGAFLRALEAARAYEGSTAPNPPVGCVLLDADGSELAVAAHQKAGELHAEALAIDLCRRAGVAERIHSVVVTLEPCNHTGRTAPCTDAILSTSAKAVWIGARDPNPRVPGAGAERLARAGLDVRFLGDLEDPARQSLAWGMQRLIAPFRKRVQAGLPWVTVKQALRPDGSMIPPAGQKTFTSQRALTFAHLLRRRADVIATGSGTVLADNPEFTVRHVSDFAHKRRRLAIFDRKGRVPESYLQAAQQRGFVVSVENSLHEAFQRFAAEGALEVLVEAGPRITEEVLSTSLWDEHIVIEQGSGASPEDHITIKLRSGEVQHLPEKDQHVLRNR